jgi:chaperone modulatory protein CbpM
MMQTNLSVLHCQVVEEDVQMTLADLCRACDAERELVLQLVEHGVIEPLGDGPQAWVFAGASLRRTRVALRLLRDLELNLPGAALAVDLLDQIARLQRALQAATGGSRGS